MQIMLNMSVDSFFILAEDFLVRSNIRCCRRTMGGMFWEIGGISHRCDITIAHSGELISVYTWTLIGKFPKSNMLIQKFRGSLGPNFQLAIGPAWQSLCPLFLRVTHTTVIGTSPLKAFSKSLTNRTNRTDTMLKVHVFLRPSLHLHQEVAQRQTWWSTETSLKLPFHTLSALPIQLRAGPLVTLTGALLHINKSTSQRQWCYNAFKTGSNISAL